VLAPERGDLGGVFRGRRHAGDDRDARRLHPRARLRLAPHRRDRLRVGADPDEPGVADGAGERGVLGEEAEPGWTRRAPVRFAASISFSATRYDSRAGAGPIPTAWSESRTWSAARSASEKTATGEIPRSRQARAIRTAISPRFAISSLTRTP
jgi:hypothetical protein